MRVAIGVGLVAGLGLVLVGAALFVVLPLGPPAQAADPASVQPSASSAPSASRAPSASPAAVSDTAVEDGRLLYVQNCASCHGAAGQGSQVAPALTNSGSAALDFYMRTGRMPLGRIGTPAWEQPRRLSDAEIAAIIGYASGFSQGPAIPQVTTSGADLSRGWQLYINNCGACHGPSANGGSVGAGVTAPSLVGKDAQTIAEAMLVGPGPMPRFAFSEPDQTNVAGYIDSLATRPNPGGLPLAGTGPVPEGLVAGIVGVFALIWIARFVARNDRLRRPPHIGDDD